MFYQYLCLTDHDPAVETGVTEHYVHVTQIRGVTKTFVDGEEVSIVRLVDDKPIYVLEAAEHIIYAVENAEVGPLADPNFFDKLKVKTSRSVEEMRELVNQFKQSRGGGRGRLIAAPPELAAQFGGGFGD